jgi:hypothetical protein
MPRSVEDVDADPDAKLEKPGGARRLQTTQTFMQEMGPLWVAMNAVEGLVPALSEAWDAQTAQRVGASVAAQMRFADTIDFDPSDINAPPDCRMLLPVDRSQPDIGGNRSIFQRLLHLVEDAAQLPLCNAKFSLLGHTYAKCALFQIDDMADFYMRAVAGRAVLSLHFSGDDTVGKRLVNPDHSWLPVSGSPMQWLTAIEGFVPITDADPACAQAGDNCLSYSVSARAANRLVFTTFDSRMDGTVLPSGAERTRAVLARPLVDGEPYDALHGRTLFAWECDAFLESIAPLVRAFVDRGQTQLLVQVMRVMHAHWPTPDAVGSHPTCPADATALVRLEPFLADMADQGLAEAISALITAPSKTD